MMIMVMIMTTVAVSVPAAAVFSAPAAVSYYEAGKELAPLHPTTRKKLEFLLHMLAEKGEEYTCRYIRKRILKK